MRGRVAALTSWSQTSDRSARTAPARAAFRAKFEISVDPHGVLPEDERRRRADYARKAHYAGLALKSAKSRRLTAEAQKRVAAGSRKRRIIDTNPVP
jgi:hypothetical protein